MTLLFFIILAFKQLKNRVGLTLSLIASVAVTISLVVCVPVFAEAVSRRIVREELEGRTNDPCVIF